MLLRCVSSVVNHLGKLYSLQWYHDASAAIVRAEDVSTDQCSTR